MYVFRQMKREKREKKIERNEIVNEIYREKID